MDEKQEKLGRWLVPRGFPIACGESVVVRAASFDPAGFSEALAESMHFEFPAKMRRAVPKRRAEFFAGRILALQGLQELGVKGGAVSQDDRRPVWPSGIVGSITHTTGLAAALVARVEGVRGIGVDIEECMTEEVADRIATRIVYPTDWSAIEDLVQLKKHQQATLVFSAKESIYKCLNPLTGVFFGFEDASIVSVNGDLCQLRFRLNKTLSEEFAQGYEGVVRYHVAPEHITTVALLASQHS